MELRQRIKQVLLEIDTSNEKIIEKVIIDLVQKYEGEYNTLACDINKGLCMNFQDELMDILKNQYGIVVQDLNDGFFFDPFDDTEKEFLENPIDYNSKPLWDYMKHGIPSHYWIEYRGRHYDSDHPLGVDNFFKLNTFKMYFNKYKSKMVIEK